MARRLLRIEDDLRKSPVKVLPDRERRVGIENRPEQWVGEADLPVDDLDDPCFERADQRGPAVLERAGERDEKLTGRRGQRCDSQQNLSLDDGNPGKPALHE